MDILRKALSMLEKHPLCDHCLGRQFALMGYGIENYERGKAIKIVLLLKVHAISESNRNVRLLRILATNGFSRAAMEMLQKMQEKTPNRSVPKACYLCQNKFSQIEPLTAQALRLLQEYEFNTFLVGIELPLEVEEREDELKADFGVDCSEEMRNEFGRLLGKKIVATTGKLTDFMKPDIVVLVDPFTHNIRLQINPLFVAGRYMKLARGIPQSKWYCSICHGKGCKECGYSGKMYPESVEEIIAKPLLEATEGKDSSFHASGREDIDARMLGTGRPFVIEIARPKKRLLNLDELQDRVNNVGKGKVKIADLMFVDRDAVRKLKKAETAQKEYLVLVGFENEVTTRDLRLLEEKLNNITIAQKTPLRVLHRRADLTREKHIYEVNTKKVTPKKARIRIRCQGGLYVKELVTGDEGRTKPSVSEILSNEAKPLKLDVLKVIVRK